MFDKQQTVYQYSKYYINAQQFKYIQSEYNQSGMQILWIEVYQSFSLFGLDKSQSRDFASQIASVSVTVIQYIILSTVNRFAAYQTIGGLFHDATGGVIQLSVSE